MALRTNVVQDVKDLLAICSGCATTPLQSRAVLGFMLLCNICYSHEYFYLHLDERWSLQHA
jgi:hypothetical protein